jgi:hypothetical protein
MQFGVSAALTQTELSTFGTRTGLKGEIQKLFVEKGKLFYRGVTVEKPSIVEIRQFAENFMLRNSTP